MKQRLPRGFTLIELAVVIVIIGLLAGGILKMTAIHKAAQAKDVITIIGDISAAVGTFKENYKYLPGDFPAAAGDIAGVNPACLAAGANAGNGSGAIDNIANNEPPCAPEHLYRAGLVRATLNAATGLYEFRSAFGTVSLMSFGLSQAGVAGYNDMPTVLNVIELTNLPCEVVLEIDQKMDNGILNKGNVVAVDATPAVLAAPCAPGSIVPFLDVALN